MASDMETSMDCTSSASNINLSMAICSVFIEIRKANLVPTITVSSKTNLKCGKLEKSGSRED
jgi:hypothetical protein